MPQGTLIEVDELAPLLESGQVVMVDTREDPLYHKGHIPGAVNISDIFTYLCTSSNGGYPALVEHFAGRFSQAGINRDDHVVLYEDAMDNGYGQSCRGWLIFSYLKHPNIHVLHGGLRAWKARGLSITTELTERSSTRYTPDADPGLLATTEDMLAAIDDPQTLIVDVRDYAEWIGANSSPYGYDYCPRKGRIPSARWLEWYRLMRHKQGIPWFKSSEEVLDMAAQLEITPAAKLILYCFKGARTSNTMMALRNAGICHVRNYLMSWNEWSRHADLPIEEGYPQD